MANTLGMRSRSTLSGNMIGQAKWITYLRTASGTPITIWCVTFENTCADQSDTDNKGNNLGDAHDENNFARQILGANFVNQVWGAELENWFGPG